MKSTIRRIIIVLIIAIESCAKNNAVQSIPIPNGDFENWDSGVYLKNWITNSCPFCVPAFETYIVQRDSNASHGLYAARFIYNNNYAAWAENRFYVPYHPKNLMGQVKCTIYGNDSVSIKIKLFNNGTIVDSGQWFGTSSINSYSQIVIPVTQYSSQADSAIITVQGGHKMGYPGNNTVFWLDNLILQ